MYQTDVKRVFYEQVTGVKSFFLYRVFAFVVVRCGCMLLSTSIRTLDELSGSKLGAGWGSREKRLLPPWKT
jgi:hypothetical protein